jgi:hypothetical protein
MLEYKSKILFIELESLLLIHLVNRIAHQIILSGPGGIVHAEHVQQGRLPGAGRTHNRDKFALSHVQIDAPKHERFCQSVLEIFFDVAERDHGSQPPSLSPSLAAAVLQRVDKVAAGGPISLIPPGPGSGKRFASESYSGWD